MSRRRSSTPRSNPTFSFPFQLPVLHPPRLAKRNSNANNVADPAKSTSGIKAQPEVIPPVRHHRRRSTLELPDVEKDGVLQIRSRRKHMVAPLTLSPRSFDAQLPSNSFCCDASGKSLISGKARGRRNQTKQLLSMDEYEPGLTSIEPPTLIQICASPRSPTLELSLEEDLPFISAHSGGDLSYNQIHAGGELMYLEPSSPESIEEDFASQFEEMIVRSARSRAQHRERLARRWESLCNVRLRLLKEQAIQNVILAEMSAAATCPHVNHSTPLSAFGTSGLAPPMSSNSPPSPSESFGAPLARMSSQSPYATYGETIDLADTASEDHRDQIMGGASSYDPRPLVDRIIERMDEFKYDEICVDGLTEAECRQLRAESRKRRRLDRQRSFELGVLLELKRSQLGRSRSSSASSSSSDSLTSSESGSEPLTPPPTPLAMQSMDHLVAKMLLKRREVSQRPCTSSIATRAAFEARGCSSLRKAVEASDPALRARNRSDSTKPSFSSLFSLSGPAWLKEKQRLTSLDIE